MYNRAMPPRVYATIGRAPDNDVVLDHPTVSNHHARLSWSGPTLLVEDLSSANGTSVDGQRIKTARTRPGAELLIGQVALPWSHEGLRNLLKAGVGAKTLVMSAKGAPAYVCGACGHVGALAPGPTPTKLLCPNCKTCLRTGTKPKGSGLSGVALAAGLALLGAAVGAGVHVLAGRSSSTASRIVRASEPERETVTQEVGASSAQKIAAAIQPLEPFTRNTAVKIAARKEGPFHVEQVAEIWAAVRQPWRYVNDPEGREYFATARESIENGYVGDCDDFAITLASMVIAIGGKARVVLMDGPRGGHAYAEACIQGEPATVAGALIKHYRNRFKRYISGAVPKEIAYRTSQDCPIWLNLDWNSSVPGGPYDAEYWAIAVHEGGRTETLAPANPPASPGADGARTNTHANGAVP
jgi:hypothetical protein